MAGLSSTMFLALKATDTSNTPASATIEGNAALNEIIADLEFALAFSEQTTNAITFTVPDRDGDSNPETIRYAWSGTPGDPITRQYNGGTVTRLVEDVHVFQHDLPTSTPNLLSNGDMEAGLLNWQPVPGSVITSSGSEYLSGVRSLNINYDTDSVFGARQDVLGLIVSGNAYDLRAWVKKTVGKSINVQLELLIDSSGEGVRTFATPAIPVEPSWRRVSGTVTPTWSGTLNSAYWQVRAVGSAAVYYADDATLSLAGSLHQHVNISLQVGADMRSRLHSGRQLVNSPL